MYHASVTTVEFVDAVSTLSGGVVVVTSRVAGRPWGMTATAFEPVTVDPPTVLVRLAAGTISAHAVEATGAFGASVLARDQVGVTTYAATPGAPKFLDSYVDAREGDSPSPAVAKALAHFDCDVVERVEAADHIAFLGRVRRARRRCGDDSLV